MKLLVTGGCGFIGTNLVHYMLEKHRDLEIVNVDKLSYGSNPKNLETFDKGRCRFIQADIADAAALAPVIAEVDSVVNIAAETHVDRSISDPFPFLESNVRGLLSILEAIRRKRGETRLLQVSTDEVYGDIPLGSSTEKDSLVPSSPYAASKASADMLCGAYSRTYGTDVVITRCTNNFGPFQFPEKLIPKSIIRAQRGLRIPVYGSGRNVRDWIYVADHCEAIDLVLQNGRKGEIYNVAGKNELSNIEIVRKILRLAEKPDNLVELVEDRPGHDTRYSLDATKMQREMGWRPRHTFESALADTVKWYFENEQWWAPLAREDVISASPWRVKWPET